ncbi:bifunctional diaminohydroxyphosphoribosylaminopyrimidine deaminase/5-amino-6-(5-phosphoribosylamino)uracil reductase RibD [Granulosicoccus antarcticus]|uniref:Riboflavin biosynthesis protein RibD n=1 Tax=Granulosicoccus antarcticus IMCC3135 TaxID=1192854 RepID=A0A2Z2NTR5_9GAMM|nr:bifunctional diaminohydroxyphosphoribosylaminopyrimidine deaminase/5-amino-6-(5-phosphoribosylamino)uracil reductase RibD [Granulosicoccus antarcticus]ASJ74663.1 Riboflavin biosynthesis protein RibD [Granulosicoccus antarcticus IMCC3135]
MIAVQSHEHYMQYALELAARGSGCTSPNPLVGSVIVRDGIIVGQGWHARYGHQHAEVNALLNAAQNNSHPDWKADNRHALTTGATLYVTLEPCNHHGLTPPCSQAILDAGIRHVVYALADPNPKAAGGAQWLQSQGVQVTHGVLEQEAMHQNRFFLTFLRTRRPHVIAKSATSLDGRIATRTGDSQWITGPEARARGHELRQAVDAIMVGADTVIADDPALTVRLPESVVAAEAVRHPRPVILDRTGRVPLSAALLDEKRSPRTLIITTDQMDKDHRQTLKARGFDVFSVPPHTDGCGTSPRAVLEILAQQGIQSVLIEGGATVQGVFRDAGLIDEIWCFIAPTLIGGRNAPASFGDLGSDSLGDATTLSDVQLEVTGKDILVRAKVVHRQHEQPPKAGLEQAAVPAPPVFINTRN